MSLDKFFGTRRVHTDDKVTSHKQGLPKEKQRQVELDYLKPEPLLPYTGQEPTIDPIQLLTVRLVFPNKDRLAQFKRHFKVARYVEPSVTNIGVLLALLDELDKGRIRYDRERKSISYIKQRRDSEGGSEVASAEQTPHRTK